MVNPSVIIEVLSPDTYDYDHGKKFMLYRQIPSFNEYILISNLDVWIEKFVRNESGTWTLTEDNQLSDMLSIESIGYQTAISDIYAEVRFATATA